MIAGQKKIKPQKFEEENPIKIKASRNAS